MVLKITRTAAEILNDILLHTLQEQGLEKAEALEQSFFDQLSQLKAGPRENNTEFAEIDAYRIVYMSSGSSLTVLAIVHTSRLPQTILS